MYRRIFVYYERGTRTGGPEALHQLVSTLRDLGQEAFLVPIPGTEKSARHPSYEHYAAPELATIEDLPNNAVVVPESYFGLLSRVRKATKYCWWLSVDNSQHFVNERRLLEIPPTRGMSDLKRLKHTVLKEYWSIRRKFVDYKAVIHLTQSQFAWSFLFARLNLVPSMLSDYTPLGEFTTDSTVERHHSVAYNFSKGRHWSELVGSEMADTRFVAIRNMTRKEVLETLASSSIYLDMGHHPGKDRLPREAALAGAVNVVARRGAGAFWADVPIPWEHKVSMENPVGNASRIIGSILEDLPGALLKQQMYVNQIRQERSRFTDEARAIFIRDALEFGSEGPPV